MTAPNHAVVSRLSAEFAAMSEQLARVSADLAELDRLLADRTAVAQPARRIRCHLRCPPAAYMPPAAVYAPQPAPHWPPPPPPRLTKPPSAPKAPRPPRDASWIGKVLAVAGVAVTLIGVVLLLVLAAQAGILRPEIRVGAGALLAGALVGVAAGCTAVPAGGSVQSPSPQRVSPRHIWTSSPITTIYDWVAGARRAWWSPR